MELVTVGNVRDPQTGKPMLVYVFCSPDDEHEITLLVDIAHARSV